MRTIPSTILTSAEAQARTVDGYIISKDNRLRFDWMSKRTNDDAMYDGAAISHDADVKSNSIHRVANINNKLSHMYISSPSGAWPNWTIHGNNLTANSRPGLFKNRCFFQNASNQIRYTDFNGSSIGGITTVFSGEANATYSIAPLSNTTFAHFRTILGTEYGKIAVWNGSTNIEWPGRVYRVTQVDRYFDAEPDPDNPSGCYIFVSDYDGKRVKVLHFDGKGYSDITYLIPLDVVDDTSSITMGGASTINGKIFVGGAIRRTDGANMQVYTYGPPWSAGRDMFVGTRGVFNAQSGGKTVPAGGGKMLRTSTNVYYIGIGIAYEAVGCELTGHSALATETIYHVNNFNFNQYENDSIKMTFDVASSISGAGLRTGADLEWWSSMNGELFLMNKFGIDAILGAREPDDQYKSIIARGKALKQISDWSPDTSYDYWGPDVQIGNPATFENVVRTAGDWETATGGGITLDKLNFNTVGAVSNNHIGTLYSIARPSRGGMAHMRFKYDARANYTPYAGLYVNYYRETKAEAASRQGKKEKDINWWDYGDNGIRVAWSPVEHSGSPGVSVTRVVDSHDDFWTTITTYSLSIPADTLYWLGVEFYEGNLRILYRPDGPIAWTLLGEIAMELDTDDGEDPWVREDELGRFAIVTNNITPNTHFWTFNSDADIVPLNGDPTGLPLGTYLVDQEQMIVSKFSGNYGLTPRSVIDGHIHTGVSQPWNASYQGPFQGYPVWLAVKDTYISHDYFNDCALVITDGAGYGQAFKVTDYDYDAPQQWVDTWGGGYTPPDNWLNHVGDGAYGHWDTSGCVRVFVDRDPRGLTAGATCRIVAGAHVTRGVNNTTPTAHSNVSGTESYHEKFNYYTGGRVKIDRFNVYTDNREWSMEEMLTEIVAKAGVEEISSAKHISGQITVLNNHDTMIANYGVKQANTIVKMKKTPGTSVNPGIQFNRKDDGAGGYTDGYLLIANNPTNSVYLWDMASSVILQDYPVDADIDNQWIKFSIHENRALVYADERLIAAFELPEDINADAYTAPAGFGNLPVEYDWPECSMRVDNFIFDMGQSGLNIIRQLIGQKRIYYRDTQTGGFHFFRDREIVNSGDPYTMAEIGSQIQSEENLATRIRVEGAEVRQVIDATSMREHGSIFKIINAEDVLTKQQAQNEAEYFLNEAKNAADAHNLVGALYPRVEAGDVLEINIIEADDLDTIVTKQIIAESVGIVLAIGETQASFDMAVQGYAYQP